MSHGSPSGFSIGGTLARLHRIGLGVAGWVGFVALWHGVVVGGVVDELLVPRPGQVAATWLDLFAERGFGRDVWVSVRRIVISFAAASVVAIPLGLAMGTCAWADALFGPLVSPARYLPAPAFVPLLLMWFGTGELQKLALLFLGVIWFLTTLVADVTRLVRRDLLEAARTLGARRSRVLLNVVFPAVAPGVVTAMRQMLAVSWTYLVIAEIVAATDGIGAMMMRARRFVRTDEVAAGILTIGLLGLAFDTLFRLTHRRLFRYLHVGRGEP